MTLTTQDQLRNAKHEAGIQFQCAACGEVKPVHTDGGTGYGYNETNQPVCYACCGKADEKRMLETGKACLYLTTTNGSGEVTNWPGTLRASVYHLRVGRHNMAGKRFDVWFNFQGATWHGTQYGENTQICHCRRLSA